MGSFDVGSAAGEPTAEATASGWRGKFSWLLLDLDAGLRARLADEAFVAIEAIMGAAEEAGRSE